jgi:hypothetical protein
VAGKEQDVAGKEQARRNREGRQRQRKEPLAKVKNRTDGQRDRERERWWKKQPMREAAIGSLYTGALRGCREVGK